LREIGDEFNNSISQQTRQAQVHNAEASARVRASSTVSDALSVFFRQKIRGSFLKHRNKDNVQPYKVFTVSEDRDGNGTEISRGIFSTSNNSSVGRYVRYTAIEVVSIDLYYEMTIKNLQRFIHYLHFSANYYCHNIS
jgi:hypothetical protein